ncbi:hypothetical protein JX266_008710 [Neoarthrinium moseri]|nr:hypothetical protein JX266_008710 [Neoarthrinium moseri]
MSGTEGISSGDPSCSATVPPAGVSNEATESPEPSYTTRSTVPVDLASAPPSDPAEEPTLLKPFNNPAEGEAASNQTEAATANHSHMESLLSPSAPNTSHSPTTSGAADSQAHTIVALASSDNCHTRAASPVEAGLPAPAAHPSLTQPSGSLPTADTAVRSSAIDHQVSDTSRDVNMAEAPPPAAATVTEPGQNASAPTRDASGGAAAAAAAAPATTAPAAAAPNASPIPTAANDSDSATAGNRPGVRVGARRSGPRGINLHVHWDDEAGSSGQPPNQPPNPPPAAHAAAPEPDPHDPRNPAARPLNPGRYVPAQNVNHGIPVTVLHHPQPTSFVTPQPLHFAVQNPIAPCAYPNTAASINQQPAVVVMGQQPTAAAVGTPSFPWASPHPMVTAASQNYLVMNPPVVSPAVQAPPIGTSSWCYPNWRQSPFHNGTGHWRTNPPIIVGNQGSRPVVIPTQSHHVFYYS